MIPAIPPPAPGGDRLYRVVGQPFAVDALRLPDQGRYDLVECGIGQGFEFFVGAVLDRMRHEDAGRLRAQALRLGLCGVDKFGGGDVDRRGSARFDISRVVQTARCAAASIREGFDHRIALHRDFLA